MKKLIFLGLIATLCFSIYSCKKEEIDPTKLIMGPNISEEQMDSFLNSPFYKVSDLITPYFANMTEGSQYRYHVLNTDDTSTMEVTRYVYTPQTGMIGKDIYRFDKYTIELGDYWGFILQVQLDDNDIPYTNVNETSLGSNDLFRVQNGEFIPSCIEILDSFEVRGVVYEDVLHIPKDCYYLTDGAYDEYWFGKNIGPIKVKGIFSYEIIDYEIK